MNVAQQGMMKGGQSLQPVAGAPREYEVIRRLSNLDYEISDATDVIEEFLKRLDNVMSSDTENVGTDGSTPGIPDVPQTAIGCQVSVMTERLNRLNKMLKSMLRRLEI